MHGAPSVTYPVGRSFWHAVFLALAALLGGGAILAWALQAVVPPSHLAVAAVLLAAIAACAARQWLRSPRGDVCWTGETWRWPSDRGMDGDVEAVLDLQWLLLLRWHSGAHATWLWLERASAPARWDDLRRAVYSRARPDALPGT